MELTLATFNIGYGGLGAESDFFMDGGSQVQPLSQALVEKNLAGITALLEEADADIYLLQEVDADAKRSYGIDQRAVLSQGKGMDTAYALNYSCDFVPFPWPPIGRVHSGLYTMSSVSLAEGTGASRYALPCPFSWPVRTANLKRCLLVARIPVAGTERELVVVNLHLEAYDDGAGKAAQTAMLMDLLQEEYAAGNYVIAGGGFQLQLPGGGPGGLAHPFGGELRARGYRRGGPAGRVPVGVGRQPAHLQAVEPSPGGGGARSVLCDRWVYPFPQCDPAWRRDPGGGISV